MWKLRRQHEMLAATRAANGMAKSSQRLSANAAAEFW